LLNLFGSYVFLMTQCVVKIITRRVMAVNIALSIFQDKQYLPDWTYLTTWLKQGISLFNDLVTEGENRHFLGDERYGA
jgi:uracil DNA glycosylase